MALRANRHSGMVDPADVLGLLIDPCSWENAPALWCRKVYRSHDIVIHSELLLLAREILGTANKMNTEFCLNSLD